MDRVLNTNELLEAILSELPCNQLLLAQRVCMTWQKAITKSEKVQQIMYLKAVPPVLQNFIDPESEALLAAAPPGEDPCQTLSGRRKSFMRWSDDEQKDLAIVPLFNRFLARLWSFKGCFADIQLSHLRNNEQAGEDETRPSWRNMLLTQPPVAKVTLLNKDIDNRQPDTAHEASLNTPYIWSYTHPRHSQITNSGGVTLGNVVDHLVNLYRSGVVQLCVEPLAPLLGSYWRRISSDKLKARNLRRNIRQYAWDNEGESPIGWHPGEDGVDHLGGPLDGVGDPRRDDETDAGYYRPLARRRAGIAVIKGKPVYCPELPPDFVR